MTEKSKKKIEVIINVIYIAVIIGIIYIAKNILNLIFPFLIAMALVALIRPLVKFIHRKLKINLNLVSILFMALLYTAVGGLVFWLVATIVFLLKDAFTMLPGYYQETVAPVLNELMIKLEELISKIPASGMDDLKAIQNSLIGGVQNLVVSVSEKGISIFTGFINSLPQFFVSLIFTILTSFFLSTQYDKVIQFFREQLPVKTASLMIDLKVILKNTVLKYLRAILILIAVTFLELTIGFLILGTPNAVGKAAGIALFDALPVFGTGGIMIPWIIIELLSGDFSYGVGLAILYGLISLVRNIIEPKVVGDQLGINPIVSLMSIYVGYRLFGVFGMIFFPMLVQILLALHQKGIIRLYKTKKE